jgi:L-amino acid N-acyltransferase YncA
VKLLRPTHPYVAPGRSAGHAFGREPSVRLIWEGLMAEHSFTARAASPADAPAVATIYNQGIADRTGTFETEPRSAQQIEAWFDGRHPIVVVEEGREVVAFAFASTSAYRSRPCYAGVAEFSVLCRTQPSQLRCRPRCHDRFARRGTSGWVLEITIAHIPGEHGQPSADGESRFREVGLYRRHGKLDGAWRDCAIVEHLLGKAAE